MRPILSAILGVGILLGFTVSASAHAHLVSAIPAADSTTPDAPTEVLIRFTEALEPRFSDIQVENAGGERVDDGAPHLASDDAKRFIVGLKPLAEGVYKVIWHATSVDTHKTEGSYQFTIRR